MQDTFYLNNPEKVEVAPEIQTYGLRCMSTDMIQEAKDGVKFDKEEAQRATKDIQQSIQYVILQKTHMSQAEFLASVVYLTRDLLSGLICQSSIKSKTVIHEPDANLPILISTLKTFYAKMGYPDVRVRPAHFYTEPW